MKQPKVSTVAARLNEATFAAFQKKVDKEHDHNASTVLRSLIVLYVNGEIKLKPQKLGNLET
jgi:hypothetical protein